MVDQPFSQFAEAIRAVKLSINLTGNSDKTVGFTSALPNEGKSTIAGALAQLAAQAGNNVILVDCDLRNPTLTQILAPNATVGICDVVRRAAPLDESLYRDPETGLWFLPTVLADGMPAFDTSALLAAGPTKRLFKELAERFDYVVVDLPPLAPVVDARAAAHLVDSMVLVVEWGRTKVDAVEQALTAAPNVQSALVGAVLNKVDMDYIIRYDPNRRSLYQNKDFNRYYLKGRKR